MVLAVLVVCGCFPALGASDLAITDLLIVHTNDLHGRITYQDEGEIGYTLIAAQVEKLRQQTERVLVLDAGDAFHGTVFATLQRGESIVEIRNSIAAGPVTRGDMLSTLPFGNTAVVIEVSGADLVAMLENGLSAYPAPAGRFPQVSGLTYLFDPEAQPGNRTSDWLVGDEPLDMESPYRLITNDYLAAGGDEYSMLKDKPILFEYGITLEALFADYLISQAMLAPNPVD